MALLLDDLQDSVPRSWLLEHITIFADDIHVYCLFRDVSELSRTVECFEKTIENLGLQLSPSKSCVITRGKGPGCEKWKRNTRCS